MMKNLRDGDIMTFFYIHSRRMELEEFHVARMVSPTCHRLPESEASLGIYGQLRHHPKRGRNLLLDTMGRVHRQETAGPNTQEAKESNVSLPASITELKKKNFLRNSPYVRFRPGKDNRCRSWWSPCLEVFNRTRARAIQLACSPRYSWHVEHSSATSTRGTPRGADRSPLTSNLLDRFCKMRRGKLEDHITSRSSRRKERASIISDIQGRPKPITWANSATQEETANGFTNFLITDQVLHLL
jgi:hypothetical protein